MVRIRSLFAARLALLQLCAFVEAAMWSEVTFNGTAPTARHEHTAVWSEAANGMYIFGGGSSSGVWNTYLNDLHFFDRQAASWSNVAFSGSWWPTARSKHTAVWSEAANGMYIFGGLSGSAVNDLHFFDRQAGTWSKVTYSGWAPAKRYGHTAVWSEAANGMYIFGGVGNFRTFNDLHFFDRQAASWSDIAFSGTAPTARFEHTAVWSEAANGMYIFGGVSTSGYFNDLHFFDRQAATMWSEVTFNGTAPGVRGSHTAVRSEAANGMYTFGGWDSSGSYFNDLHFFDRQDATTPVANQGTQEGSSASTFIIIILVRLTLL